MTKITIPTGNYEFGAVPGGAPEGATLRMLYGDVINSSLRLGRGEAVIYALAWLAVSRLLVRGEIPAHGEIQDLLNRDCWAAAKHSGLPEEAFALVWPSDDGAKTQEAVRVRIVGLLADLASQFGTTEWNISDSIGEISDHFQGGGYDSGLCDTLIELLEAPPGATVWIPFEGTGQFAIRAIRRGLNAIIAGPGLTSWSKLVIRLLAIIEGREAQLSFEPDGLSTQADNPKISVDYLLACPPIGMKLVPGAGWRKWEGSELGLPGSEAIYKKIAGLTTVQLDRSEAWAIAALWPYVKKRAVFLTAPNVLFAKGQEQRLREFLVLGAEQPTTVISLPARLLYRANIVTAITILDRESHARVVRMVDASSATFESKSTMRFTRLLDTDRVLNLVTNTEVEVGVAKSIALDEIASQECNLMPARYLKGLTASSEERISLGELVDTVVRAPVASKDATAITAQEVGIADLDRWIALSGPFAKTTSVQAKKLDQCRLRQGDILISIKGTLGKVGLIGKQDGDLSSTPETNVVCSQSVIALRVNSQRIGVIPMYLFLKSDDFKNQLEAFRVGVAVAHVTPTTLLQEVKVPTRWIIDEAAAHDRYAELCKLELEIDKAYRRIDEIRQGL